MQKQGLYLRDGRAPVPRNSKTSVVMRANKAKNSRPELILRMALARKGIGGYKLHLKQVVGRPDIAFPDQKLAVFVNGCFWHACPHCKPRLPKSHTDFWRKKFEKNTARDKRKASSLRRSGWMVFTFWECMLKTDALKYVNKIEESLGE